MLSSDERLEAGDVGHSRQNGPSGYALTARRLIGRIPSYATYVRERPGWLVLFLFGRLQWARRVEKWLRTSDFKVEVASKSPLLSAPPHAEVLSSLVSDGVSRGFSLSASVLSKIRHFADITPCASRDAREQSFLPRDYRVINAARTKDVLAGYYFGAVARCPEIQALQADPMLLGLAANYLGVTSKNIRTRLWWNFPASRYDDIDLHRTAQDAFHFDLNDWRTLKFFFYITDVDEGSAPHVYFSQSHRRRRLSHQYTIFHGKPKSALLGYYGPQSLITVLGEAGSGFAEDPFVFHTGSVATRSPRLILELEYGPYDPSPSYRYGELG